MMKKALQSAGRKFDKQAVPYCSASAESRRQSTAAILGQMVGSYLADTLGWFGVERVPFNPVRLVGIGLLVLGVLLVQRK